MLVYRTTCLQPTVSPADGHLSTPTVAGLPGLCENFRPTASNLTYPQSSHWATSPTALSRLRGGGVVKARLLLSLSLKKIKSGEYLAKLQAKKVVSRALSSSFSSVLARRTKCTRQPRSCLYSTKYSPILIFFHWQTH